jgi:iron complex outermembrane receptor protein
MAQSDVAPKAVAWQADASAQQEGSGAARSPESDGENSEVIVTGRRDSHLAVFGDTGIRKIPLSILVVGAEDIAASNAKSLEKILLTDPAYTPNYGSTGLSSGVTNGYIRGFYASRYMSNGVPQNFSWNIAPAEATERVEVLRGPSAFSYGFMAPGGAINVVSKAPPQGGRMLTLHTAFDQYGKVDANLDTGARLGADEKFGYRLNVAATEGDAYLRNSDVSRRVAALAMDYRLSDATVLSFQADNVDAVSHGEGEGNRRVYDVNGNLVAGIGMESPVNAPHHFYDVDIWTAAAQLDSSLAENIDLTSKLSHSDYGEQYFNFYDWGDLDAAGTGTIEQGYGNYFIQDWNFTTFLNGRFGEGNVRHNMTLGVSAGDSKYTATWSSEILTATWQGAADAFPDTFTPAAEPYSVLEIREYGAFLSDVIEVRDRWRALLGLRWSRQTRQDSDPSSDFTSAEETFTKATPLIGVMYDVVPQLSLYANYATGIEAGGRAPNDASNRNELMPALVSKQYEAGMKWQLSGGATLDTAIFQITRPSEFYGGPQTPYVQDGEQRHRGAELLIRGRMFDSLRVMGGIQYLDAEILETGDPAAVGSRPQGVPEWQGALSAELDVPVIPGLSLLGVVTGKSERQRAVPNDNRIAAGYVLFDVGARYGFELGGREAVAQIRVENVGDREYAAGSGWLFGVPRTVWASLEWKLL